MHTACPRFYICILGWCSRNVMLQAINSHLSMAIIRCTSTIICQSQFMVLSCPASLSTKDTAPTHLHPAPSISFFEHYRRSGLDVRTHASSQACSLVICVCHLSPTGLGNGWPTGENGTPLCECGSGDGRVNRGQEATRRCVICVCCCKPTMWHRETVLLERRWKEQLNVINKTFLIFLKLILLVRN